MKASPTMRDVASLAGVSPATVSNVINRKEFVDPAIRDRVWRAVEELGYRPGKRSRLATMPDATVLRARFITLLGLSMTHYYTEGMQAMAEAVRERATERGVQVIEYFSDDDSEKQIDQISEKISRRVDAVICFPVDGQAVRKSVLACHQAGIPFVSLNRFSEGPVYAVVKSDDYQAGHSLALYLAIAQRAKKISILELQGSETDLNSALRSAGFNQTLQQWPDCEVVEHIRCGWSLAGAREATLQAFGKGGSINAVFAQNDELAQGAFEALEKLDRAYPVGHPEHVIILGVDGNRYVLDQIRRGLIDATAEQRIWDQGRAAVDLALEALEGKPPPKPLALFPTILVTRENVGWIEDHWINRRKPGGRASTPKG